MKNMGGLFAKYNRRLKKERREGRHRFSETLKQVKTWQLFLALIPLLFLSATFLRFDHLKMNELKNSVLQADRGRTKDDKEITSQEEIDTKLKQAILDLKKYTESHIVINFVEKNGQTSLVFGSGPFYLENQYNRKATVALSEAEKQMRESGDNNPNGNVFAKAMEVCKPQAIANGWAWNSPGYINCMTGIINSYPITDKITTTLTANIPPTSLYRYDFSSPIFAPTLAGFTILICLLLIIVIFFRIIFYIFLRIALVVMNFKK